MNFTTEQVDIISMISVVLKKIPYCYCEDSAEWWISHDEVLSIDFEKREIQFFNFSYSDDTIYLQILGIAQMFDLNTEDYIKN